MNNDELNTVWIPIEHGKKITVSKVKEMNGVKGNKKKVKDASISNLNSQANVGLDGATTAAVTKPRNNFFKKKT